MAETTKADLEKEIHGLKVKLGRAESKVSELEAELAAVSSSASTPVDADRVFGPDAVPLEQR
jgi:hypothetical protein